jgi:hypothetical protein
VTASCLPSRALCGVALALTLALACTRARQPGDPTPLAVNPARATAAAAVQVEISGRDLDARVKTDLSAGGAAQNGVDAGYAARLEPASGAPVSLADVRLTERHTLLATIPAGLAQGSYRLVIVDPAGRTGSLEHAYRVLSSAASVARFDVAALGTTPRAGVAFPVSVVALDAGGAVVDGFDGAVTLSDTAGLLPPASAGPFVLGRWGGAVTIAGVASGDALVATDAAGHAGASAPFDVIAGPPVALVFPAAPLTVAPGACSPRVALALRDGQGIPAAAEADLVVQLQSAPPGLALFADAGCTTPAAALTIATGADAGGFHFLASAPGDVTVRAVPATLPSATQVETVAP